MGRLTCEICGEIDATETIKVGVFEFDACRTCSWGFIQRQQQHAGRAKA